MLYVTKGHPGVQTVDSFEASLFGPFQNVLVRDVVEFKPYVFQIFAQLLEMRKGHGVSQNYWCVVVVGWLLVGCWLVVGWLLLVVLLISPNFEFLNFFFSLF